jgi:hypothetical protein
VLLFAKDEIPAGAESVAVLKWNEVLLFATKRKNSGSVKSDWTPTLGIESHHHMDHFKKLLKNMRLLVAASFIACSTPAFAQVQSVNRAANGPTGTDIRIGVYVNVQPDCTSGPLPSIRLISGPESGKVVVKRGKVTATNYRQCLAMEVPAFIAVYRSRPDFTGVDVLTLEVKFAGGRTEQQRISITVGTGSPGRGI